MATSDQIKWDKKYKTTPSLLERGEPSEKLVSLLSHIEGNKVLDVACGSGRNSIFLAEKGFVVESVDISQRALSSLDAKGYENINTQLIDLDTFKVNKNTYDLIIMTNYLDRQIIPKLLQSLTQNGILFIETYMNHISNTKKPSNPKYLLEKDELKTFVTNGYQILKYDEFDNESYELYRMKKQSISIQRVL